jgi:hypothetical protein
MYSTRLKVFVSPLQNHSDQRKLACKYNHQFYCYATLVARLARDSSYWKTAMCTTRHLPLTVSSSMLLVAPRAAVSIGSELTVASS